MVFQIFFAQIRGWKEWERETTSHDYEFSNGMSTNDVEKTCLFML